MSKFEIEGQQYRAGKLNAFAQLHVARKIAPVLGGLAALQGADSVAALKSLADVIAAMPDADCEYVLHTCRCVPLRQVCNTYSQSASGIAAITSASDLSAAAESAPCNAAKPPSTGAILRATCSCANAFSLPARYC